MTTKPKKQRTSHPRKPEGEAGHARFLKPRLPTLPHEQSLQTAKKKEYDDPIGGERTPEPGRLEPQSLKTEKLVEAIRNLADEERELVEEFVNSIRDGHLSSIFKAARGLEARECTLVAEFSDVLKKGPQAIDAFGRQLSASEGIGDFHRTGAKVGPVWVPTSTLPPEIADARRAMEREKKKRQRENESPEQAAKRRKQHAERMAERRKRAKLTEM